MKKPVVLLLPSVVLGLVALLQVGFWLTRPSTHAIRSPPMDLPIRGVSLQSEGGGKLQGLFVRGKRGAGGVLLMHVIHASRVMMLDRARFLHRAGYSVFLFDFQAHGESSGQRVTFGAHESFDAQAAA